MSQTAHCMYCGAGGHWQETCPDRTRDEILRMSYRAKLDRVVVHPSRANSHQTTPGRMTFTTLTTKD